MTATYGDIIYVQRIGYRHFGVYVGNDKVIHYTKASGSSCDGIIRETSIEFFLDGSQEYVVYEFEKEKLVNLVKTLSGGLSLMSPFSLMNAIGRLGKSFFSDLKIYSSAETVKRARSCIGQKGYNLLTNNCEHFSIWCKTGVKESEQIEALLDILPGGEIVRAFSRT